MKSGSCNSALISPSSSSSVHLACQITYQGFILGKQYVDIYRLVSKFVVTNCDARPPFAKNDPLVRGLLLAVQSNANPSENPTGFEGHKDEDDEKGRKEALRSLSPSTPARQLNSRFFVRIKNKFSFSLRSAGRSFRFLPPNVTPRRQIFDRVCRVFGRRH